MAFNAGEGARPTMTANLVSFGDNIRETNDYSPPNGCTEWAKGDAV
jgi:hypothetical protein